MRNFQSIWEELPSDWCGVSLGQYITFRKIFNPSKENMLTMIGGLSEEELNGFTNEEREKFFYKLYFCLSEPESQKYNKFKFFGIYDAIFYNEDGDETPGFENDKIYYKLLDLKKDYYGTKEEINFLRSELKKNNLDCLPTLVSRLIVKPGEVFDPEISTKNISFFNKYLPITLALSVKDYFLSYKSESYEGKGMYQDRVVSESVRNQVWRRAEGKCETCGSRIKLEFDHIIPISKGGSNTYRNIQLLCESCNRSKGNKIG